MNALIFRRAENHDLDGLLTIEQTCFSADRLSKRSFRRHLNSEHCDLMVTEQSSAAGSSLIGYGLTFRRRGTRLSRLYSLAVLPSARGLGVAQRLLSELESLAVAEGRHYMRLEVAKSNHAAIKLYQQQGYRVFGEYSDYYEDHSDALRMQKKIQRITSSGINRITPWYKQTMEFTCGPAALMMAMNSLDNNVPCSQENELDIWREATTVFMTSGHGGCHPFGLALAAHRRGFEANIWVNSEQPLFLDGVRSDHKKQIMAVVHNQFQQACQNQNVAIHYQEFDQQQIEQMLRDNFAILVLISTYQLEGKKAPHWVVITGMDERCFYVHDPDLPDDESAAVEYQYVPIAREDFANMSTYGSSRLRTAVAIKKASH
ncbi:GNAT family N-acetyltransferase/peptidase C39 family protein [Halioxenophilus sp. WMMB6]|uniref:GNAT family N-acetyltransferase/peptidase C39 family protein n=1 Tax=Halioxenophilus sp. WMMB6 TaxID=3073815 RepID=UPI00295F4B96|nr:GNAT family N-acetyltransferase/peptidase C39 family protein [Halioxenophilus sp. WMMB6]